MKRFVSALLLSLLFLSVFAVLNVPVSEVKAQSSDYTPIKWAVIILGGWDYYFAATHNPIQKLRNYIHSRGVPFDLFQDDDIEAPTDTPSAGKYPLQYANGTIRYQVIILQFNHWQDTDYVNKDYILHAVGNGTNVVLLGHVLRYFPELMGLTADDIIYDWVDSFVTLSVYVAKTFDDGVKEFVQGTNLTMGDTSRYISCGTQNAIGTVWLNVTSTGWESWRIGMMNTTYYEGKSWFLMWDLFTSFTEYVGSLSSIYDKNRHIWYHAFNFMLNNVEQIPVKIQPYKRWQGGVVVRHDEDSRYWKNPPPEEAFQNGWKWLSGMPILGCGVGDQLSDTLYDGFPEGYTGCPSSKCKWADIDGVPLPPNGVNVKTLKLICYNSTVDGKYDRIKFDFDGDKDFSNENAYEVWEYATHPTIQGKLFWAAISPNFTEPSKITIGWYQNPMLFRDGATTLNQLRNYGQQYGELFTFHSLHHFGCGETDSVAGVFVSWNGTHFVQNQTWVSIKLEEARDALIANFSSTGYGFEADKVVVHFAGDNHPRWVDEVLANKSWIFYENVGYYSLGFYKPEGRKWFMYSFAENEFPDSKLERLFDFMRTLLSYHSWYGHGYLQTYNPHWNQTNMRPYTNDIVIANAIELGEFFFESLNMLTNVTASYYLNNKVVLEYSARSNLTDYVWRFPVTYNGKHFQGFTDNRTVGKIKHFDGKYVYIEFSSGGNEKITATYGDNPHIHKLGHYVENATQTYTTNNLQLTLWNATNEALTVEVDCTTLGQPYSVKYANGTSINFNYNTATKICIFNVSFASAQTVNVLWSVEDTTPPTYSNIGYNTTTAGQPCKFSCKWTDNVELSGFIFGWKQGAGSWQNDTWASLSGGVAWANVTKTLPSTAGVTVQFRWWCNDTSNNWGDTGIQSFTTTEEADTTAPTYSDISYSTTKEKNLCEFRITWQDNVALGYYIFSWNGTGTWQNNTAVAFTTNPQTVTVTKTLPVKDTLVCFKWYANDTSGNMAETTIGSFTTVVSPPEYSDISYSTTIANTTCTFSVTWSDESGLSHWIFSWNGTGVWQNDTITAFTSNPQTISVSKVLPQDIGIVVAFKWYANDTDNNLVFTSTYTFETTAPGLGEPWFTEYLVMATVVSATGGIIAYWYRRRKKKRVVSVP